MFSYLYKRYKSEILSSSCYYLAENLRIYEHLLCAIVFLFAILTAVFCFLRIGTGAFISAGLFIAGLAALIILHIKKVKKQQLVKENIEQFSFDRLQKVARLLMEYGIDITDAQQLDNIINRALNEQKMYDIFKSFRKALGGVASYAFVPVVSAFFAVFLNDTEWQIIVEKSAPILLIFTIAALILVVFYISLTSIFNPDIRNLDYFIRDVEDVKVFSKKTTDLKADGKA